MILTPPLDVRKTYAKPSQAMLPRRTRNLSASSRNSEMLFASKRQIRGIKRSRCFAMCKNYCGPAPSRVIFTDGRVYNNKETGTLLLDPALGLGSAPRSRNS